MSRRALSAAVIVATLVTGSLATSGSAAPSSSDSGAPAATSERDAEMAARRIDAGDVPGGDGPAQGARVDPALRRATGTQRLLVRLARPAVAEGGSARAVKAQQNAVVSDLTADLGVSEIARVHNVLNGVFVYADASDVDAIAADRRVESITLVRDYEMDLSDTVPHIGATTVQGLGVDGTGVTVAVLDSGVDYTHEALGGAGTEQAWLDAAGAEPSDPASATIDAQFPSAKVIGGYDFVGENWPGPDPEPIPEEPDPDPIDREGHGTHVADIIAGTNGVAPGASIFAIKVCSAVDSACSGVALIQGMDLAVDPDEDNDTSDHVDIINMSLGADYGMAFDDDLSLAVDNATALGVLTVASAGNGGNKPFITGTPAAAPTALSVAQTTVPSEKLYVATQGASSYYSVYQTFSPPLTTTLSGPLQYGDGAGGNLDGCSAFTPASLATKVVLVDRGGCTFTSKMKNVSDGGAVVGVIAQNSGDAPFAGSAAGDVVTATSFMISQADGTALKAQVGETVTFDPDEAISTAGNIVGSSSRGPSMLSHIIKPEIGAPGASVSALVGTGDGTEAFGGTSGAAPMVSGAAALILDSRPSRTPLEVKAALMNTGDRSVRDAPSVIGGQLTPISRIGGGEVRVDAAEAATAVAYVQGASSAALSFGFPEVSAPVDITKTVEVKNFDSSSVDYTITPTFRDPADESRGAVTISAPESVTVPVGSTATFDVTISIDPTKLEAWGGDSGELGVDPTWLDALEYDGYIELTPVSGTTLALPWQVLPRLGSDVAVSGNTVTNSGEGEASIDVFSVYGQSPDIAEGSAGGNDPVPDLRAVGYSVETGMSEACSDTETSTIIDLAFVTWEPQSHAAAPVSAAVDFDIDRDGNDDVQVYSSPLSSYDDGRTLSWLYDYASGDAYPMFFVEHDINSAVTVMSVCVGDLGLSDADLGLVDVRASAYDSYFTLDYTDEVPTATIDLTGPRHGIDVNGTPHASFSVPSTESVDVAHTVDETSESEDSTVMLLQRGGAPTGEEMFLLGPWDTATDVAATGGDGRVRVTWTAPTPVAGPITGYRVRLHRAGAADAVVNLGASARRTTFTGLTNGTPVTAYVTPTTADGDGDGASATATPKGPPTAPGKPVGTPRDRRVSLTWPAPSSNGGLAITGYRIQAKRAKGVWRTVVEDTGSARRSATVTGLANGKRYRFRVAAINEAGTGANSRASNAVRPER
jgi:subtilisin family serine protease